MTFIRYIKHVEAGTLAVPGLEQPACDLAAGSCKIASCQLCVRMIIPEHAAASSQDVLMQILRRLALADRRQVNGQAISGPQCVRVVLTRHSAAPGHSILMQVSRRLNPPTGGPQARRPGVSGRSSPRNGPPGQAILEKLRASWPTHTAYRLTGRY